MVMETVEGYVDDGRSTVYICDGRNPDGSTIEYCYHSGAAEEISELTGLTCHATGFFERTSIVGCWYHCDSVARGCNAHNSCYCP